MKTILIADDDRDIRSVFGMRLEAFKYRLLEAETGLAALQLAKSERPDLLVLDRNLPGIDGMEVMQRLQEDQATAALPVIIVSGMCETSEIEEGLRMGAYAYLVKPVSLNNFCEIVRAALGDGSA